MGAEEPERGSAGEANGVGIAVSDSRLGWGLRRRRRRVREVHAVPELALVEGREHFIVDGNEVPDGDEGIGFDSEDVFGEAEELGGQPGFVEGLAGAPEFADHGEVESSPGASRSKSISTTQRPRLTRSAAMLARAKERNALPIDHSPQPQKGLRRLARPY